jgi:succinate dehydrogenase / fumarate reductase cytochrome b subunit
MFYRWKTGMFAWVLFRLSGLALVFYLSMHIFVISNLHDPSKFDAAMKFLGSWYFRVLELGLLGVVIYHAMNGVRVVMIDFFGFATRQSRLFWSLAVIGVFLFLAGAYPMVSHALYWKNRPAGTPSVTEIHNATRGTMTNASLSGKDASACPYMGSKDKQSCNMKSGDNCCPPATDAKPAACPAMGGTH